MNLEIERGEFVCVMGPSGSGKSSLLYLLGLLDVPTSGRIWIDGEDTTGFDDDELTDFRLARLGYVFQFHFLLAEFSVLDNVSLPIRKLGRLADDAARERAAQLLDRLGLEGQHDKRPSQLSGGQRQRVAIARALANDPLVILADEPTGNLDSASSANVRDILRGLTRELNKTVVAVTHDAQLRGRGRPADRHCRRPHRPGVAAGMTPLGVAWTHGHNGACQLSLHGPAASRHSVAPSTTRRRPCRFARYSAASAAASSAAPSCAGLIDCATPMLTVTCGATDDPACAMAAASIVRRQRSATWTASALP